MNWIFLFIALVLAGYALKHYLDGKVSCNEAFQILLVWCFIWIVVSVFTNSDWEDKATQYETHLLQTVEDGNRKCNTFSGKYANTYEAIRNRSKKPSEGAKPFSDVYESIRLDELRKCRINRTFNQVLLATRGIDLDTLVGLKAKEQPEEVEKVIELVETVDEPVILEEIDVVNTSEGDDILSPELYDKVFDAVKSCNRAKIKLIDLTDQKDYLTSADYNVVMGQVMKCKAFELETELNK